MSYKFLQFLFLASALILTNAAISDARSPADLENVLRDQTGSAHAIARQDDGKLVVAGVCIENPAGPDSIWSLCLTRLLSDGSLDTTFAQNGVATATFVDGDWNGGTRLLIQPDGRILVVGRLQFGNGSLKFALLRYNTDGTLDQSFARDGLLTGSPNGQFREAIDGLAVQSDGKIVAVGASINDAPTGTTISLMILRLTSSGHPDNSFGLRGKLVTSFDRNGVGDSWGLSVMIQPDGRYTIVGKRNSNFSVLMLFPNGMRDTSFGVDGSIGVPYVDGEIRAVVLQPDGKMLIAGDAGPFGSRRAVVVRLDSNGLGDNGFGVPGSVGYGSAGVVLGPPGSANAIEVQSDGKILVAGRKRQGSNFNAGTVTRYLVNGQLDQYYGRRGVTAIPSSLTSGFNGIVFQPDGNACVAGSTGNPSVPHSSRFAVFRFNYYGEIDSTFSFEP